MHTIKTQTWRQGNSVERVVISGFGMTREVFLSGVISDMKFKELIDMGQICWAAEGELSRDRG